MKVKFKQAKGRRYRKSQFRPMWIEPENGGLYFDTTDKKWSTEIPTGHGFTMSYYAMRFNRLRDVFSIKAAVRLINSWDIPAGTRFHVGLPWVGFDAVITKT